MHTQRAQLIRPAGLLLGHEACLGQMFHKIDFHEQKEKTQIEEKSGKLLPNTMSPVLITGSLYFNSPILNSLGSV